MVDEAVSRIRDGGGGPSLRELTPSAVLVITHLQIRPTPHSSTPIEVLKPSHFARTRNVAGVSRPEALVLHSKGRFNVARAKGTYLYFYWERERQPLAAPAGRAYVLAPDAEKLIEGLLHVQACAASGEVVKQLTNELGEDRVSSSRGLRYARRADQEGRRARRQPEAPARLPRQRDPPGTVQADQDRITKEEPAAKAELARTEPDLGEGGRY